MEIRPATAADAPALARVHVDAWHAAYRELAPGPHAERFDYARREQRFRESLAAGSEETHAVLVREEIVGFLTLGAARDADLEAGRTGEIWGIYISPGHWRQGIGRKVVEEAEGMLRARAYEQAILWVLEDNEQARRFYEAMGFRPDGKSKEIDWGAPVKAVRYAKALRPVEAGST